MKAVGNSRSLALCGWLLGGVLSLLGALTYGELTALNPQAGGLYVYIRDCVGRFPAFLFGWILFLVVSTGSIATLAVAFSNYLREVFPVAPWGLKLVSLSMIGIIAAVNIVGTRRSADLQNVSTVVKLLGIVAVAGLLLWFSNRSRFQTVHTESAIPVTSRLSGIGIAVVSILWAHEGWQYTTYAAGEALNSRRDFPLAFLAGIFVPVGIYSFGNVGYVAALGPLGVAKSNRVAATAVATVFSPGGGEGRHPGHSDLDIQRGQFRCSDCITRLLRHSKRWRVFSTTGRSLCKLRNACIRSGSYACWAAVLAASGSFEQLLTCVVFVGWGFYVLPAASIFAYRKRNTVRSASYRVPSYPWTPLVFIATVAAVVVNTILAQPVRAAIRTGIVLTGAPAYLIWRKG
jgi:APA family basic amino acid/polyamine antiporter